MFSTQFLNHYHSVVLDNDGVIMDSNAAKTDSFAKALEGEKKELIDEFISYHKAFGGVSRFEKIKYFYSTIKKEKNYLCSVEKTLQKYAYFSKNALLSAKLIPGIEDFLKLLKKHNKSVYVVSGGDQKELIEVYTQRDLMKYFTMVNGSPKSKDDILEQLNNNSKLSYPAIYFGDAKLDYLTATKYDLDFVFIYSKSEWSDGIDFCEAAKCLTLPDFL